MCVSCCLCRHWNYGQPGWVYICVSGSRYLSFCPECNRGKDRADLLLDAYAHARKIAAQMGFVVKRKGTPRIAQDASRGAQAT